MRTEIIQSKLGTRLTQATGLFFEDRDQRLATEPQELWLEFENDGFRVRTASDGWEIAIDTEQIAEIDMQELGSLKIRQLAQDKRIRRRLGKVLRAAYLVKSLPGHELVGLRLDFQGREPMRFLNWGDELHWGERLPPDYVSEEHQETLLRAS